MNKNIKIIIIIATISLLTILIAYGLSFHKLTVKLTGNFNAIVYEQGATGTKNILTTNTSKELWIRDGIFCVMADDPKYNQEPVCAVVEGKDKTLRLDPDFSDSHLEELLGADYQRIHDIIRQKFDPVINGYQIDKGKLLGKGDYYATTMIELSAYYTKKDTYRIIMKKTNGSWDALGKPEIVVNKYNYPNVERDILIEVNDLVSDIY